MTDLMWYQCMGIYRSLNPLAPHPPRQTHNLPLLPRRHLHSPPSSLPRVRTCRGEVLRPLGEGGYGCFGSEGEGGGGFGSGEEVGDVGGGEGRSVGGGEIGRAGRGRERLPGPAD